MIQNQSINSNTKNKTISTSTSTPKEVVSLTQWFEGIVLVDNHHGRSTRDSNDNNSSKNSQQRNTSRKRQRQRRQRRQRRLPLIDLRSYESFAKRHIFINQDSVVVGKTEDSIHDDDDAKVNDEQNESVRTRNNDATVADEVTDDNDGVIVNLPFTSLKSGERSCELPPRNVSFAILIPRNESKDHHNDDDTNANDLPKVERNEGGDNNATNNGDNIDSASLAATTCSTLSTTTTTILDFFFATKSKATSQSRKPWLVKQIIYETDDFWKEASLLGILYDANNESLGKEKEGGDDNNDDQQKRSLLLIKQRPLPRLWKPDYMVQTVLLPLLKDKLMQSMVQESSENIRSKQKSDETTQQPSFTIVDLGSGAGRDVCFLAEELKYFQNTTLLIQPENESSPTLTIDDQKGKINIVGIDNHKGSAKRCIPLWKHRHVSEITHSVLLDLNKVDTFNKELLSLGDGIVCLYAIRFLNRKLIKHIAGGCHLESSSGSGSQTLFSAGTIFVISHFCKRNDGDSWNFDHPKESSVLERNELHNLFTANGRWEIVKDDICLDSDHGRTLINFIAVLQ